jgi:phosphatidylinositol glycan class B
MPRAAALALPAILLLGFALRAGTGLIQTRVVFFDETQQYFEQAHRLAFGTGMVPWEYADGIRSWLLPGLIALLMRGAAWFSDNPMLYVGLVRTLCAALSMVVVLVGYRTGARHGGRSGALLTGGFCAIWFDLVYFAPAVLTEVLAAHCAIAALYLGEDAKPARRVFWIGALFGLAVCVRYQYAPALGLAVLWQYRERRDCWSRLLLGAAAVLLPFSGVLDAITWGSAFQSMWLNFAMNAALGATDLVSRDRPAWYLEYLSVGLMPLPLLLGLAAIGARRFPALAVAAVATILVHSAVPHKEVRYIYLAIAAAPILIGLGATDVLRLVAERSGPRALTAGVPALLAMSAALSWFIATGPLGPRWSAERGMLHVFLAAHRQPDLCGLRVQGIPAWKAGGYTWLNRDVPLTFDPPPGETHVPGRATPLRGWIERAGAPVPQLRGAYSHVVAEAARAPAGYDRVACFPADASAEEPELCLFRRPGGCSGG